jgi:hypothetical protein
MTVVWLILVAVLVLTAAGCIGYMAGAIWWRWDQKR